MQFDVVPLPGSGETISIIAGVMQSVVTTELNWQEISTTIGNEDVLVYS